MRTLVSCILALSLAAAPTPGQSFHVPSDTPGTGPCNIVPFGTFRTAAAWKNQKYQFLVTRAQLGNKLSGLISDIGFSACGGGNGVLEFDTIEIVVAQTPANVLSKTFAANLSQNVRTVLQASGYAWQVFAGEWQGIGFDVAYPYDASRFGPNLVVQITVTGAHKTGVIDTGFRRGTSIPRIYATDWTVAGGPPATGDADANGLKCEIGFGVSSIGTFGAGCGGARGVPTLQVAGEAELGEDLFLFVSNCVVNTAALQVFGANRFEPRFDLAVIGAQGCHLYVQPDILAPAQADLAGQYFLIFTVPMDRALLGATFYTQGFPADASANRWGRSASRYARLQIGL